MSLPDRSHRLTSGRRRGLARESLARVVAARRNSAARRWREPACTVTQRSNDVHASGAVLHQRAGALRSDTDEGKRLCLDEDTIAAFVDGQLNARLLEAVDAHLGTCRECLWLVTAAAIARDGAAEPATEGGAGEMVPLARVTRWPERFERRQLIAQGGMGAVYYGYDRETNAAVAIKELRPGLELTQPALLKRFIREAEVLRRLAHPNIVELVASVSVGEQPQIVMEYMGGGSLRQRLRDQRRLPVAQATAIVLELADALARAHHLGVIHRDIKPENVLLTKNGTPKLGDFGLALVADSELSTSNSLLGTIAYLSPEGLTGQTLDARADLWSLGVMLFELLTGQRPFEAPVPAGLVTAILHQPTPDLQALCPGLPVALVDLVHRLLEKDSNQRIGSARQVAAELEAITGALGDSRAASAAPAGSVESLPPSVQRSLSLSRLPAATAGFVGRAVELAELILLRRLHARGR